MAYNPIADGDIDPDSPITTGLMTNLRDNPIAIANGDAGAPKIQTAAYASNSITSAALAPNSVTANDLADNTVIASKIFPSQVTETKIASLAVTETKIGSAAVAQVKLKTATVSLAGTLVDLAGVDIAMNAYAFWPNVHADQPVVRLHAHTVDGASPDAPRIRLQNNSGVAANYDFDYRHVIV